MAFTFAAVDKQKTMKNMYNTIFPEDAGNDAEYLEKATVMFERLRGIQLWANTTTNEGTHVRRMNDGNRS